MGQFENKRIASRRILFPSGLNLTKITNKSSGDFAHFSPK